jgi:hypothetical protein
MNTPLDITDEINSRANHRGHGLETSRGPAIVASCSTLDHAVQEAISTTCSLDSDNSRDTVREIPVWYRLMEYAIRRDMFNAIADALNVFAQLPADKITMEACKTEMSLAYRAKILIRGSSDWSIYVDLESSFLEYVVTNQLGLNECDPELMQDLTNEFANLIGGGFKSMLSCDLKLGLPQKFSTDSQMLKLSEDYPVWKVDVHNGKGQFHVYVSAHRPWSDI